MSDNDISKRSIKPKEDIDSKILELTKIIEDPIFYTLFHKFFPCYKKLKLYFIN